MSKFNYNLRQAREKIGLSAKDIAEKLRVTPQTYSNYENKGTEPKYDVLIKLTKILGVTADQLLGNVVTRRMFLATKLRALRTNHNLSLAQEATLLGITRAPLNQFENEKALPQFSTLLRIADLYAVSTDWLLDRTNNVYDNVVLYELEKELLFTLDYSSFIKIKGNPEQYWQYYYRSILACIEATIVNEKLHDYYNNREDIFSLPVRANIVFCFQVLKYFSVMLAKIIEDLNLDDPLRDISDWNRYISNSDKFVAAFLNNSASCWEKWNGYFTQYETKRAANAWLTLFKNCYNLLEKYLEQKIDPKRETFIIN